MPLEPNLRLPTTMYMLSSTVIFFIVFYANPNSQKLILSTYMPLSLMAGYGLFCPFACQGCS